MGFYSKFEQLCQSKGITSVRVREELGISQSTMASWKSRGLTPKYETVKKLADYFGVTVDYLLGTYTKEPGKRVPTDNANDRYPYLLNKKLEGSITLEESKELATLDRLNKIAGHFETLTEEGQQKAVERVEELTEIPKYQKKDEPDQK